MSYKVTEKDLDFLKATAAGEWEPFLNALDPNVRWWINDDNENSDWATGVYNVQTWKDKIAGRLRPRLADKLNMQEIRHWIVGDTAILEAKGEATQKNGKPYNNRFAWFFVFGGHGKVIEIREYMNTALVQQVLADNEGV